jgi:hypothetical protein
VEALMLEFPFNARETVEAVTFNSFAISSMVTLVKAIQQLYANVCINLIILLFKKKLLYRPVRNADGRCK